MREQPSFLQDLDQELVAHRISLVHRCRYLLANHLAVIQFQGLFPVYRTIEYGQCFQLRMLKQPRGTSRQAQ